MNQNPATACARELVTALVAAGVRHFVLAPGSRSAPLAYALAAAEEADWCRVHVHVDERTCGFVALGLARDHPAAVITTSGTAVANLHPAVLEAHHGHHPLVVITADRPHRLRGVGANQTTDQVKIFGAAVRQAWEVPAGADAATTAAAISGRAVAAATGRRSRTPGPVHLNVAFDDPLTPGEAWQPGARPEPVMAVTASRPGLPTEVSRGPNTVVVAGDGAVPAGPAGEAVRAQVEQSGWPVIAEPSSGLRGSSLAVPAGHVLVRCPELAPHIERVIVIGRPTLHRSITALLARTDLSILVLAGTAEWTDVAGTAGRICDAITVPGALTPSEQRWQERWRQAGQAARTVLTGPRELDGPTVARELLSRPGTVMLGSSMAARYADLAGPVSSELGPGAIHAGRGLAGIDGTLATATGLALGGRAVRALVGDLTFQHDAMSLARGRFEGEVDLQVIVLDDDGGSIFATLEHGRCDHAAVLGRYFRTPQALDVSALADAVGAQYTQVRSRAELRAALDQPVHGRSVLHIRLPETRQGGPDHVAPRVAEAVSAVLQR